MTGFQHGDFPLHGGRHGWAFDGYKHISLQPAWILSPLGSTEVGFPAELEAPGEKTPAHAYCTLLLVPVDTGPHLTSLIQLTVGFQVEKKALPGGREGLQDFRILRTWGKLSSLRNSTHPKLNITHGMTVLHGTLGQDASGKCSLVVALHTRQRGANKLLDYKGSFI